MLGPVLVRHLRDVEGREAVPGEEGSTAVSGARGMRLRKKRGGEAPAPQGVRIRRSDGSAVECRMLRDPDQDEDGAAAWVAVPLERVEVGPGDSLEADVLPARTSIVLDLPLA